jgi:transaldolase
MEIFIDSADVNEIKKWLDYGIAEGVTTNPTILLKCGVYDIEKGMREIAKLINPLPLCVEVTTNDLDEMLAQARHFNRWAGNIVVKIPQINEDGVPCYGVMRQLESEAIKVNATATLSFGQVMLAAKAGATYISIFAGRISDEGGDASDVIKKSVDWLGKWHYKSKLVIGSMRSVGDVLSAALAGAHVITIPPEFIGKMADHKYTRATVAQFMRDAKITADKMTETK